MTTYYNRWDNPGARFGNHATLISERDFNLDYEFIGYGDDEGNSDLYRHKRTGAVYSLSPSNDLTRTA